jgi:hypothetical protein
MFSMLSKVKTWAIAALSLALPIVYVFGRLIGKNKGWAEAESERLKNANKKSRQVADFYKEMAEDEQIVEGNLHKRDNLTERLRDKGL